MAALILLYFVCMRSKLVLSQGQHLEMITKKAFGKYISQGNRSDFLSCYRESHHKKEFIKFAGDLKYEIYQNPGDMEVFKWIKEAEEEMHKDAKDIYNCVLTNFGGSHELTVRIVEPEGGFISKIREKIEWKCFIKL